MKRRSYLGLVGAVGASVTVGCLSADDETPGAGTVPDRSPTDDGPGTGTATDTGDGGTPSATAVPVLDVGTPPPGECEADAPPLPQSSEGLPDPRAYPDGPPSLTEAATRQYLEEYEAAYRYNRQLAEIAARGECLSHLDASVTESIVSRVENGVTAEVTTRASYTGSPCPDAPGTDTPTPLPHADLPHLPALYYLTERFLLRDGTVVECWE